MRATLEKLGVTPSFSRPSVSNDNAYSESLFKTLKYSAGYPKAFKSIEYAKKWVLNFVNWYNYEHRHSKIGYVTPQQRLSGKDKVNEIIPLNWQGKEIQSGGVKTQRYGKKMRMCF